MNRLRILIVIFCFYCPLAATNVDTFELYIEKICKKLMIYQIKMTAFAN